MVCLMALLLLLLFGDNPRCARHARASHRGDGDQGGVAGVLSHDVHRAPSRDCLRCRVQGIPKETESDDCVPPPTAWHTTTSGNSEASYTTIMPDHPIPRPATFEASATCTMARRQLPWAWRQALIATIASLQPTVATALTWCVATRWRPSWRRCSALPMATRVARAAPCICTIQRPTTGEAAVTTASKEQTVALAVLLSPLLVPRFVICLCLAALVIAIGIVGAQVPLGAGIAWANKYLNKSQWYVAATCLLSACVPYILCCRHTQRTNVCGPSVLVFGLGCLLVQACSSFRRHVWRWSCQPGPGKRRGQLLSEWGTGLGADTRLNYVCADLGSCQPVQALEPAHDFHVREQPVRHGHSHRPIVCQPRVLHRWRPRHPRQVFPWHCILTSEFVLTASLLLWLCVWLCVCVHVCVMLMDDSLQACK